MGGRKNTFLSASDGAVGAQQPTDVGSGAPARTAQFLVAAAIVRSLTQLLGLRRLFWLPYNNY